MGVLLTGVLFRPPLARSAETHQVTRAGKLICTGDTAYTTGCLTGQSLDTSPCPLPLTAFTFSAITSIKHNNIKIMVHSPQTRYKVMS